MEDNMPLEVEGKQYEVIDEVTDTQSEADGEQYEAIDEVTDTRLESEDGPTEESVTQKTRLEIQSFVTEGLKTEQRAFEESTEQAKNGESNIMKPSPHTELMSEVVGIEITSEANRNVSEVSDVEKIPNVINRSTEKRVDSQQSSADQTEVEDKHFNLVHNMTDSQAVPENSGKVDENSVNTEAKQANGSQKRQESVKSKSLKAVIQSPPSKQPIFWDSSALLVGGLFPGVSGACERYTNHPVITLTSSVVNYLLILVLPPHIL